MFTNDEYYINFFSPITKIIHILGHVSAFLIIVIMCLTTFDVLLRYSLGVPVAGSYEFCEMMFTSVVFLGLSYTQIHKSHVRVEFIIKDLNPVHQLILETLMLIISLFIFTLFLILKETSLSSISISETLLKFLIKFKLLLDFIITFFSL